MNLLFNSQDSQNNYLPFGSKWAFEYASYILITPSNGSTAGGCQVRDGDGRMESFTESSGSTLPKTYVSPPGDFRTLVRSSTYGYDLIHQDGTVYHYGVPSAMEPPNYTPPPPGYTGPPYVPPTYVPLLLSVTDRHGNAVTITHNSNGAILKVEHSALPNSIGGQNASWNLIYSTIGSVSRVTRIDDPFGRSAYFTYDAAGMLVGQTDMGGLAYSYQYTSSGPLFATAITTPTGTTTINTEASDGIANDFNSQDGNYYTSAYLAMGYDYSYPLPKALVPQRIMWDNYRITVKDHLGYPTEYYYDAQTRLGYVRDPVQMQHADGTVRPAQGSRAQIHFDIVGKGVIDKVDIYSETSDLAKSSVNSGYSETTTLPGMIDNGNGGWHGVSYNTKGNPTTIDFDHQHGDSVVDIAYISNAVSSGIDVETVTRSYNGVPKTLAHYTYYSGSRDIQTVTDVNLRTITFVWYANGLPKEMTDSATGDVIAMNYDSNLRPTTTTIKPGGIGVPVVLGTTTYDQRGNLQITADADGRTTSYEYDDLNRVTRELHSDDSFTVYQWACCFIEATRMGKLVGGVEKTLRRKLNFHDKRALPLFTVGTDGGTTTYVHDIAGRLVELTDPKNQVTKWAYNGAGQLMEKIYPDLSKENFTYIRANLPGQGKIGTYTNRRNQVDEIGYDYDGRMLSAKGDSKFTFDYDSWRRPLHRNLVYDPEGNSGTFTLGYDFLDRLTSVDGPWIDDTVGYVYNDAARTVTRTGPGGMSQTVAADGYGRVSSISNALGTFTNAFADSPASGSNPVLVSSLLQNVTHTGGANAGFNTAFTYKGYDFDRALESAVATKPGGGAVATHTYGYDPLGNIQTWKREAQLPNPDSPTNPTNPTHQFDSTAYYDQAGRLSSLVNKPLAGSTVKDTGYHYLYDLAGNIASKQVESTGSSATMTTYAHNNLNQLTGIGGSGGVKQVIVRGNTSEPATVRVKPSLASVWKDARMLEGNRFESDLDLATGPNSLDIQAADGSNNVSNYTYSLTLAAATAAAPTYDLDGNMTSDGVRTYTWDRLSRLTKIAWGAGSNKTTEYKYNALGQRSERIEKTGTTVDAHYYYLYDGIRRIARFSGGTSAADMDRVYLSQGERRKTGGTWASYYYCRDHLGSVREVMNANGTLAARYDYDPYGKRRTEYLDSAYAGGCEVAYTSHYIETSPVPLQGDLELTQFRAYDPELGRWLSADPIGENGGLNLYQYVGASPIVFTDFDGLDKIPYPGKTGYFYYTSTADLTKELDKLIADSAGNERGQCVSLVKQMAGLNGKSTAAWIPGPTIKELLDKPAGDPENGVLVRGVAMATFNSKGKFEGHSVLYKGMTATKGADGNNLCNVYDQYPHGATTGLPKFPGPHAIPFSGKTPAGHGNNWGEFRIILTK